MSERDFVFLRTVYECCRIIAEAASQGLDLLRREQRHVGDDDGSVLHPVSLATLCSRTKAPLIVYRIGTSILWFPSWIPNTGPATFGACVGLFFLAAFSRFVEALRVACSPPMTPTRRFLLGPECACATLFMLWSCVNYFLMLAVMQINVWWFVAILLGLLWGEFAFGRYCRAYGLVVRPGSDNLVVTGSETKAGVNASYGGAA
jgi:hypothetical protein